MGTAVVGWLGGFLVWVCSDQIRSRVRVKGEGERSVTERRWRKPEESKGLVGVCIARRRRDPP